MQQQNIKMENRAWKGVRLVTQPIILKEFSEDLPLQTHLNHIYEITFHVCANHFVLEQEFEETEMFVSSIKAGYTRYTKGSYAKIIGFSKTIAPLIKWIEQHENVKIEITDPNIAEQEAYDIEDNIRVLKKYPSWKHYLKPEEIIS